MTWVHRAVLGSFGFGVGASVGSFLNVCVWRLPRGESLVRPPSRCPRCGARIAAFDNVPVLSWLLLHGRCRRCAGPIAARYPLVEAATGSLFALTAATADPFDGDPLPALARVVYLWSLLGLLLATALIVHDRLRAPDRLVGRPRGSFFPTPSAGSWLGVAATTAGSFFSFLAGDPFGVSLNLALFAVFCAAPREES